MGSYLERLEAVKREQDGEPQERDPLKARARKRLERYGEIDGAELDREASPAPRIMEGE